MKNFYNKVSQFFKKIFTKSDTAEIKRKLPEGIMLVTYIAFADIIVVLCLIAIFIIRIL
jgi:hypothetical protein